MTRALRYWPAPPALQAVVWQALGSAATLGAALWVTASLGLAAQGEFGLAKSWFDAAAAICALGLPQGLLHLHYRRALPLAAMRPWLARGGLGLGTAALLAAGAMLLAEQRLAVAVLLSLPFAVGHLLARSVLLAQYGPVVFGIVTALPALCVLGGVAVFGMLQQSQGFDLLLLAAAALAGSTSIAMAWRSAGQMSRVEWSRTELWQVSLKSWLQGAFAALMPAGLLATVTWSGHDAIALGAASLGLHLYQLFAVLAGYVAPLLFDHLARQDRPALTAWPAAARRAAMVLLGLASIGVLASAMRPPLAAWLLPLSLMLTAGIAAVAARVHATVLLARGEYSELSRQAFWRLALALGLTALALRWLPAAAAVALALLVIEALSWWRAAALTQAAPP